VAGLSNDFTVEFPPLVGAHAIRVISAEIPMAQYTIHASTYVVDFYDSGAAAVCSAVLTHGNYTGAQLATELATQMTAACGVPGAYTVTFSAITQKLTITRNGGGPTFGFRFASGPYAQYSAARVLGFLATDSINSLATTITSTYIVQLQGEDYVHLALVGLGNVANTEYVNDVVAKVVFPTGARSSALDSLVAPLIHLGELHNLRQLHARLYRSDGQLYELNNMDMSFTLEVYCTPDADIVDIEQQ
jgi:hypothetical protein